MSGRSLNERLFDAVAKGDAEAVAPLMDKGADPAWANPLAGGETALFKALESGREEVAALVFERVLQKPAGGDGDARSAVVAAVRRHVGRPAWVQLEAPEEAGAEAGENGAGAAREADLEARVEAALQAFARGEFLVVTDNEDRENEGDLIIAAEHVTPDKMAFLIRHTSGIVCVATTGAVLDRLQLQQMVEADANTESHGTAFTVSVDYRHGTTTGISASDRAITVRAFADAGSKPGDFARPGHIFPLRARPGGVLERGGHTEAAVDLCRLAGVATHAGAISEIVREDGRVARSGYLRAFAAQHGLRTVSVDDLVRFRKATGR